MVGQRHKKRLLCTLLPLVLLAESANALITLSGSGKRYPLAERSTHQALIQRIKIESEKVKLSPETHTVRLKQTPEVAAVDQIRMVATTYTQSHDVVSLDGTVILAKGTRIEPLKFFSLPVLIVVEDDPGQLKWARKKKAEIEENAQQAVFILLSKGSARQVAETYHLRVYHLDDRYVDRFDIKRVPCTIRQKGLMLEVHEYAW